VVLARLSVLQTQFLKVTESMKSIPMPALTAADALPSALLKQLHRLNPDY
jgi:hypothetical protein